MSFKEYPKWIAGFDVVVFNKEEEDALKGESKPVEEVKRKGRPRKTVEVQDGDSTESD